MGGSVGDTQVLNFDALGVKLTVTQDGAGAISAAQVVGDIDAGADIITTGQYLRPTARHRKIHRYVHPDEFERYRAFGSAIGIPHVESGPLVRSSYHAKDATASVPNARAGVPVSIGKKP